MEDAEDFRFLLLVHSVIGDIPALHDALRHKQSGYDSCIYCHAHGESVTIGTKRNGQPNKQVYFSNPQERTSNITRSSEDFSFCLLRHLPYFSLPDAAVFNRVLRPSSAASLLPF